MIYLGVLGLFLGLASRIFVPWLNKRRLNPDEAEWSWRYVWPQLIGVLVAVLLLPLVLPNLERVLEMSFTGAYVLGWGAADIGRFADKLITKS